MNVVVLVKAVPNTSADERLLPDLRLDRAAADPIINPNDEYALEVAIRFAESVAGVHTTMLSMGPAGAWPGLTKGIAAGIHEAILVTDPALEGSCALSTANVLAAALKRAEFDLAIAGLDTPDGRAGIVPAAVASLLGVPFLSHASAVSVHGERVEIRRLRDDGHETLEAALPALVTVTQTVGELRYPTLRGIMAARSRRPTTWSLTELGLTAADVGGQRASTAVLGVESPAPRPPTKVVTGTADAAVREVLQFLAERRLLP